MTWEHDVGGLHVCMRLERISEPFNAGKVVALKFKLSNCPKADLHGGELELLIPVTEASRYMLGDEFSLRIRMI